MEEGETPAAQNPQTSLNPVKMEEEDMPAALGHYISSDTVKMEEGGPDGAQIDQTSFNPVKMEEEDMPAALGHYISSDTVKMEEGGPDGAQIDQTSFNPVKMEEEDMPAADILHTYFNVVKMEDDDMSATRILQTSFNPVKEEEGVVPEAHIHEDFSNAVKMEQSDTPSAPSQQTCPLKVEEVDIPSAQIHHNSSNAVKMEGDGMNAAQIAQAALNAVKREEDDMNAAQIAQTAFNAVKLEEDDQIAQTAFNAVKLEEGGVNAAQIAQTVFNAVKMEEVGMYTAQIAQTAFNAVQMEEGGVNSAQVAQTAFNAVKLEEDDMNAAQIAQAAFNAVKMEEDDMNAAQIAQAAFNPVKREEDDMNAAQIAQTAFNAVKLEEDDQIAQTAFNAVKLEEGGVNAAQIAQTAFNAVKMEEGGMNPAQIAQTAFNAAKIEEGLPRSPSAEIAQTTFNAVQMEEGGMPSAQIHDSSNTVELEQSDAPSAQDHQSSYNSLKFEDDMPSVQIPQTSINLVKTEENYLPPALFAQTTSNSVKMEEDDMLNSQIPHSFNPVKMGEGGMLADQVPQNSCNRVTMEEGGLPATQIPHDSFNPVKMEEGGLPATQIHGDSSNTVKMEQSDTSSAQGPQSSMDSLNLEDDMPSAQISQDCISIMTHKDSNGQSNQGHQNFVNDIQSKDSADHNKKEKQLATGLQGSVAGGTTKRRKAGAKGYTKNRARCCLSPKLLTGCSSLVMNTVESLKRKPFFGLTPEEKAVVKRLGPDRPALRIEQPGKDCGKEYIRKFSTAWYEKKAWLTGCATRNALFCFPCLLFGGEAHWTKAGVTDLKHLSAKVKKHEMCKSHVDNYLRLAMYGSVNIATQLNEEYRLSIKHHNDEVNKNRYILSKLIDCIRFCGAFELALRGHDEAEDSKNPGVFRGLVDFVGSIDRAMQKHLETAMVFEGTSKTIQNELLDCMFAVTQEFIVQELRSTQYVTIQANDTTSVSTTTQSVLVFRYMDARNQVVERFFCFNHLKDSSAETIATAVLAQLNLVFPEPCNKHKLIAQSFDGANVISGESGGVQKRIRDVFPNAHYVHCYAHQLNLIMEQAVSQIFLVRIFFGELTSFPAFFSRSPQRMEVYQQTLGRRLSKESQTSWNFHICTISTIYAHREELLECFETIANGQFDLPTVGEASGFIRTLGDRRFLYLLFLFHDLMPFVDILYNELQKQAIDALYIKNATDSFVCDIRKVRKSTDHLDSRLPAESVFANPRLKVETLNQAAKEVCDILIVNATERFGFTGHLQSATLLDSNLFKQHEQSFPVQALKEAIEAYPMLNKEKLCTELSVIYGRPEFQCAKGVLSLYDLFIDYNLQDPFSETIHLLKILITTPMMTAESERCFSTLKRIKTFLRNTMTEDRLNALAMLSMEKELIKEIPDFNERTIVRFAALKERHAKLMYKSLCK